MTDHTPTPWHVIETNEHDEAEIGGPDLMRVGSPENICGTYGGLHHSLPNAEFIVLAVNNHDKLVAALEMLLDDLGALSNPSELIDRVGEAEAEKIFATLAAVKEPKP